jgi:hypothetical protein
MGITPHYQGVTLPGDRLSSFHMGITPSYTATHSTACPSTDTRMPLDHKGVILDRNHGEGTGPALCEMGVLQVLE